MNSGLKLKRARQVQGDEISCSCGKVRHRICVRETVRDAWVGQQERAH